MKFFIDENIAPQIGRALQILQQPLNKQEQIEISNIRDVYGRGVPDEEWIPEVGKLDGVVITQDINIQRTKHQRDLYREYDMGAVFLKPPKGKGFDYWTMVEKMIESWPEIKEVARREKKPFAFVIRPRSRKLEKL